MSSLEEKKMVYARSERLGFGIEIEVTAVHDLWHPATEKSVLLSPRSVRAVRTSDRTHHRIPSTKFGASNRPSSPRLSPNRIFRIYSARSDTARRSNPPRMGAIFEHNRFYRLSPRTSFSSLAFCQQNGETFLFVLFFMFIFSTLVRSARGCTRN